MYLKNLEICVLIYTKLILQKVFSALGFAWQADLKKTKVKLDFLTNIDMSLMVYKGIRGGISYCKY